MSWKARLFPVFRELRVNFNAITPGSAGTRSFLQNNYNVLKKLNPGLPFLIRDGDEDVKATLYARYCWGEEESASVENMNEEQVVAQLKSLYDIGLTKEKGPDGHSLDRDIIDEVDVRMDNLQ